MAEPLGRALEKARIDLRHLCQKLWLAPLRNLVRDLVITPAFFASFGSSVGSAHAHHAYAGGLVVHVVEVAQLIERLFPSDEVLLAAALLHDVGKIYDYTEQGESTSHHRMIRHVYRSAQMTEAHDHFQYLSRETQELLIHYILAHHGRCARGSPIEPQNEKAAALHFADRLSAEYGEGR